MPPVQPLPGTRVRCRIVCLLMRSSLRVAAGLLLLALLALLGAAAAQARVSGGTPVALVTAENENEVLAVSLPGGKVLRRVHLSDPETIVTGPSGPAVVVSPRGTVTLLDARSLKVLAVLHSFRSPQVAAVTPDGEWVYVTDAATGELSVIELLTRRVVDRVYVGAGAHHIAISPDFQRAWVALGETARTIVVLDTATPNRPRVSGHVHTKVAVHDLAFAPDGQTVWVSSASAPYVSVLNANSGRLLATVAAGPGPQHIVFGAYAGAPAFVTSGYGSTLEAVNVATRKVLRRVAVPYGSFNVAAAGGLVATSSLLDGAVTEFTSTLHRWMDVTVAPHARDIAISVW
jgi:DNA-binding beta-propeller fold protein YncE